MSRLILLFLFSIRIYAYTDGNVLKLAAGQSSFVACDNRGVVTPQQCFTIPLPVVDGTHQNYIWLSLAGYPERNWVTALTTTNTGTSGCTAVTATWASGGLAQAVLAAGAVASWNILNTGTNYASGPTVTTQNTGCMSTPAATATVNPDANCTDEASKGVSCSVLINMERGQFQLYSRACPVAGCVGSETQSARGYLPFVQAPCQNADNAGGLTLPIFVHGFVNYTTCVTRTLPMGYNTSDLWLYLGTDNLRDGFFQVRVNTGPWHTLSTTPVRTYHSDGAGNCTGTTQAPHGLVNGQKIYQNGFSIPNSDGAKSNSGAAQLQGVFTITSVPSTTSYVVACPGGLAANTDWITDSSGWGAEGTGWFGQTVSGNVFYLDQAGYQGGMNSTRLHLNMAVPIASADWVAGAVNTISLRFLGDNVGVVHGAYFNDLDIISDPFNCLVSNSLGFATAASGTQATLTTTSSCGLVSMAGDLFRVIAAPEAPWAFNGRRSTISATATTVTFNWGPASGAGSSPYTLTTSHTYTVPTSQLTTFVAQPQAVMVSSLIGESAIHYWNPATDQPVYSGGNAANGKIAFQTALLKDRNPFIPNHSSQGHCNSCHSITGGDLAVFLTSADVWYTAARGRGRNDQDAANIIAYIESLNGTNPLFSAQNGRMWNPPFQPYPTADSNPSAQWLGGGGIQWQLGYDNDLLNRIAPAGVFTNTNPNQDLGTRTMPQAVQFPTWPQWLPKMAPEDIVYYHLQKGIWNATADVPLSAFYTHLGNYTTGLVSTTLAGTQTNVATTISLTNGAGIATNDYIQVVDDANLEYEKCTANCGTNTPTVSRGCNPFAGTCVGTAFAHNTIGVFVSDFTSYKNTENFLTSQTGTSGSPNYLTEFNANSFIGKTPTTSPARGGFLYPSTYFETVRDFILLLNVRALTSVFEAGMYNMADQADQEIMFHVQARSATWLNFSQAATQYTRGWAQSPYPFDNGPHVAGTDSGGYADVMSIPEQGAAHKNFDYDTMRWYDLAHITDVGDRISPAVGIYDPGYMYGFVNIGPFTAQPGVFYLQTVLYPIFMTQNSWAWKWNQVVIDVGSANAASGSWINTHGIMPLHWLISGNLTATASSDYLVTETQKGNLIKFWASWLANQVFPTYTYTTWQGIESYCPTNQVPSVSSARTGSNCPQDQIAMFLALANTYGAAGADITAITTWADNVYGFLATGGSTYHFATAAAMTCSYAQFPRNESCM